MTIQNLTGLSKQLIATSVLSMLLMACTGGDTATSDVSTTSSNEPVSSSVLISSSQHSQLSAMSVASSSAQSSLAATNCSTIEVQQVFTDNSCMLCHNAQIFGANGGGLNLESPNLGREILGVVSRYPGASCSDELLIDPIAPEDSLLLKLINEDLHAELSQTDCQRQPMPQTRNFMSDSEFQCVSSWVEHVAATQVPVSSSSASSTATFMPTTPAQALSKAKYMLHGGAPTAEELATLTAIALRHRQK